MEFFKKETHIDFMGIRHYTWRIVIALWIMAIGLLLVKGLNFGLDFTGGTQVELRFSAEVLPNDVKKVLETAGFHSVKVQQYGSSTDLLVRVSDTATHKINEKMKAVLTKAFVEVDIRRTEFVGSEVGAELIKKGGIAVLVSIFATMVYIALRFEYRLAVSAAVGLLHDALLILGIFSLFGFEFDLATLASILAVLGYSLNDTIVVFDRIRENFRQVRKSTPVQIINLSINQTLSRTIMTSVMTLLVVLALLFFGGKALFGFSMAFFLGIIIATFSSIYVGGALALWLGLSRADLLPRNRTELEGP